MKTNAPCPSRIVLTVERLRALARQLRHGEDFSITRLTIIKTLCADPLAAAHFGLFLTNKIKKKAAKRYRPLIDRAVVEIRKCLARPSSRPPGKLLAVLRDIHGSQDKIERHRWADVRLIHSTEALLAEDALQCIVRPWESSYWGYKLARDYAEKYDPRYGTGLVPASASAVEDIVAFWAGCGGSGKLRFSRKKKSI